MHDSIAPHSVPPRTAATNQAHEVTQKILDALKSIRYGSIEIVIHDAKVVQIERKEKIRFAAPETRKGR